MYEYRTGNFPQLSLLNQGPERKQFMPEIKVKRDPRGTFAGGESRQVCFKFDLDRYCALVDAINRYPAKSLGAFVREEIRRWHEDDKNHKYISRRYDLSYKPAHIIEGMQLIVQVSNDMHHVLRRAARTNVYTVSALVRVLVERRLDELQLLLGNSA